jgi:hypothetical protein
MTKNLKKFTAEKNLIFCDQKLPFTVLIPSPPKRKHPALQNMKF